MTALPDIFDARSGAVLDVIAAHNQHGPYLRPRSAVTNPATANQTTQRGIWRTLALRWAASLSQAQRDAWDAYAAQRYHPDPFAPRKRITGQNEFMRANVARVHAGHPRVNNPPTLTANPVFTFPRIRQRFDLTACWFTVVDEEWAHTDGAYLLIYLSPILPPTVNFWRTPHDFFFDIAGNSTSPPLAEFNVNLPVTPTDDCNLNFRATLILPDGRVSQTQNLTIPYLRPPVPIKTQSNGSEIQVQFDKPLQFDSLPALNQFPKKFAPRTATTRWQIIGAGAQVFIDPDQPDWLFLSDSSPFTVANAAAISYASSAAPYLVRQNTEVRVQPFDHPIPWN